MQTEFNPEKIVKKQKPTFYFIGVTTGHSAIMKLFPLWMKELGRPEIVIEGIDHPIHDDPQAYRATVAQIKYDPLSPGGLITTHKMDLFAAAKDMFDNFDPYAQTLGEVSCISKQNGRLEGHAIDPIAFGLSLSTLIGPDYFKQTGGHVLCLGAGGAALATLLHLINRPDRPARLIAVDKSQARLDHMRQVVDLHHTDISVDYVLSSTPHHNDTLLAALPPASLVINATGMGKDTPGSPLTKAGLFPQHGIIWEFNYRGERDFLHQALRQKEARKLRVEDGWLYFLHGWTQTIAQVLHIRITGSLFERLAQVAESLRK